MNYVKRLVGLPGEEVFIRDGFIWINGSSQFSLSTLAVQPSSPSGRAGWGRYAYSLLARRSFRAY